MSEIDLKYLFIKLCLFNPDFWLNWANLKVKNLPEGRENNFLIKSLNPKMPGSNSGRKEKENRNKEY